MRRIVTNIRTPLYILNGANFLASTLLLLTQYLPDITNNIPETILTGLIMASAIFGVTLTRQGRTQEAAVIFLVTVLMVASVLGYLFSGLANPAVIAMYFVVLPFAGLYLERRFYFISAGVVFLLMLWFYVGGLQGFGGMDSISIDEFAVSLTALIIVTGTLDFTSSRFRNSLSEAETNRKVLTSQNEELLAVRADLELRVAERTQDLDRRNRYLTAISEIVRETSALLDENAILQRAADLIAQRFDLYHVGIFLVDIKGEYAVLSAASSEGGRQMIERGHRLLVGKQGMVGYVTGIGLSRITQDTTLDRIHSSSPELPDTRSEMALPLKARDEIIGALDIQASMPNSFSQQDVNILQTLADQLALAISNSRLYRQSAEALEEVQRAYGELNRRGWLEAQRQGRLPAYRYFAGARQKANRVESGSLPALDNPNATHIPIRVRGQVIGTIDIERQGTTEWSTEEQNMLQTISDQLGIALDGARLFDATQQRAANERLISELTAEIRESLDMETILRTTADRLRQELALPEVTIRLTERAPQNGQKEQAG
ncbi:MAG: GAF domain-containing protein [Anaerolineae bacterium]|nr:MAG: GAF domain-containing protein [Anaerolineae bacterium]